MQTVMFSSESSGVAGDHLGQRGIFDLLLCSEG